MGSTMPVDFRQQKTTSHKRAYVCLCASEPVDDMRLHLTASNIYSTMLEQYK